MEMPNNNAALKKTGTGLKKLPDIISNLLSDNSHYILLIIRAKTSGAAS